jgi:hypothetical protein
VFVLEDSFGPDLEVAPGVALVGGDEAMAAASSAAAATTSARTAAVSDSHAAGRAIDRWRPMEDAGAAATIVIAYIGAAAMSSAVSAFMVDDGGVPIPEMSDLRRTPGRRPRPPRPYSCTNARPPAPGRPRPRPSSIAATRPRGLEEVVAGGATAAGISTLAFERSGPPPWCPTWPLALPIAAYPRRSPEAAAAGGGPDTARHRRAAGVVSGPALPVGIA